MRRFIKPLTMKMKLCRWVSLCSIFKFIYFNRSMCVIEVHARDFSVFRKGFWWRYEWLWRYHQICIHIWIHSLAVRSDSLITLSERLFGYIIRTNNSCSHQRKIRQCMSKKAWIYTWRNALWEIRTKDSAISHISHMLSFRHLNWKSKHLNGRIWRRKKIDRKTKWTIVRRCCSSIEEWNDASASYCHGAFHMNKQKFCEFIIHIHI